MWSGNNGPYGRDYRYQQAPPAGFPIAGQQAPPAGFPIAGQPARQVFAQLHENDRNTTWREIYDPKTDRMYYWNIITNRTQWKHPGVAVQKQPSPPSSPPSPKKPAKDNRPEYMKWEHLTKDPERGDCWHNTENGKYQRDRPKCCFKYKK